MSAGARDALPMNLARRRASGHTNSNVDQTADRFRERFDGKQVSVEERKAETTTMVNEYYDLVTDFYEYGWGQNFHFAPRYVGESFYESIARHEHFLAYKAGFKATDRILDLGCGVGGPARNMVRMCHCKVMGVNNNEYQISRARRHDARLGMTDYLDYSKADFNEMPFANEEYDGAYAIEATCHASDRVRCFSEVFRVLKPGASFVLYEWVTTPKYDQNNERHRSICHGIELGDGLPELTNGESVVNALKKAGFIVDESFDLIEMFEKSPLKSIPWYDPLKGNYTTLFGIKATPIGRYLTGLLCRAMEFIGLAHKGTHKAAAILEEAAVNLVLGGQEGIFTPSFFIKAHKPAAK